MACWHSYGASSPGVASGSGIHASHGTHGLLAGIEGKAVGPGWQRFHYRDEGMSA